MKLLQMDPSLLENNIRKLLNKILLVLQLTAVHLVDAHLCSDPGKYISALLLSLSTMLHLELPHINVLSKIDLIENYGRLGMFNVMFVLVEEGDHISNCNCSLLFFILTAFNLDFYTDVQDLSYLQCHLDQDPRSAKYRFDVEGH